MKLTAFARAAFLAVNPIAFLCAASHAVNPTASARIASLALNLTCFACTTFPALNPTAFHTQFLLPHSKASPDIELYDFRAQLLLPHYKAGVLLPHK